MTISNIIELRNDALNTLDRLKNGEIKVDEVTAISKVYQNIMVSLKLQMEFASLLGKIPEIEFMGKVKDLKMLTKI